VLGFDEPRWCARAGWLRKKDPPPMTRGILPPQNLPVKGKASQIINK
jgi:hypothetical protein